MQAQCGNVSAQAGATPQPELHSSAQLWAGKQKGLIALQKIEHDWDRSSPVLFSSLALLPPPPPPPCPLPNQPGAKERELNLAG